jgi:hypothetical protein
MLGISLFPISFLHRPNRGGASLAPPRRALRFCVFEKNRQPLFLSFTNRIPVRKLL